METGVAAARWAETWQRAWPAGDAAAIELLYAPYASYRSSALADPEPGGVTVLRFDVDGRVVDHVDYWLSTGGRREPYPGWAS